MPIISLVSIDIDGTLLREGQMDVTSMHADNLNSLKNFCQSGGKIILSTGRDLDNTLRVYEHLIKYVDPSGIPYLICFNGALVIDCLNGCVVKSENFFDESICRLVVSFLDRNKYCFFCVNSKREIFFRRTPFSLMMYHLIFRRRYLQRKYSNRINFKNIQKVMLILRTPSIKQTKNILESMFSQNCYLSSGPRFFIEIIDRNINKFYALRNVSGDMGIGIDSVAAIGNEGNDIMSLENVGYGVGVDLRKPGKLLQWDDGKINLHVSNAKGNAVSLAIEEIMRLNGWSVTGDSRGE